MTKEFKYYFRKQTTNLKPRVYKYNNPHKIVVEIYGILSLVSI